MNTKTTYELFSVEWRDTMVDVIEECHFALCTVMPIQDADLCWNYLVDHFYYTNHYGEA